MKSVAGWLANYRRAGAWNAAVARANLLRRQADVQYLQGRRSEAARSYKQAADAIAAAPVSSDDVAGNPDGTQSMSASEYRDRQVRELRGLAWGAEHGALEGNG